MYGRRDRSCQRRAASRRGWRHRFPRRRQRFNRSGYSDRLPTHRYAVYPGAISGNGAVSQNGSGTVILANNNTYTGGTTINAGTLQVGNGGASGSLNSAVPIVNNSLLVFNTSGSFTYSGTGLISGPGNVIVQGGGFIKAIGNNTYSGWTVDANTTFQPLEGQDGALASGPVVTNNGTLRLVGRTPSSYPGPIRGTGRVQIGANNVNVGVITFTGTNTYTGGTFIGDNELVLGDGVTPGLPARSSATCSFVNNFTSAQDNARTLTFNRPDNFSFAGNLGGNNDGSVVQNGAGKVTLTGSNTYTNGTTINAGTVQVGTGGTSGSMGSGPVANNSVLVFDRSDSVSYIGDISGAGAVVQYGLGILRLPSVNNTVTGSITVSNGTLVASSSGGDLDVMSGAALGAGGLGTVGTLSVGGNLNMTSGTLLVTLNKSLSPSNSTVTVAGATTITGSTLKLLNYGPALVAGDKFTVFSGAVTGLTILSPGYTFADNNDGSYTVTSVAAGSPAITHSVSAGTVDPDVAGRLDGPGLASSDQYAAGWSEIEL